MRLVELRREGRLGEGPVRSFQARLSLLLEGEVPPGTERELALEILRRLADGASPGDFDVAPEGSPSGSWEKPVDLDLRVVKSAHRLVQEVARRSDRGRAVLASDLILDGGLSAPTIGRLLREGNPGADYLARFVHISQHGRTKAIDLTPEGRVLASRIRAGVAPV